MLGARPWPFFNKDMSQPMRVFMQQRGQMKLMIELAL